MPDFLFSEWFFYVCSAVYFSTIISISYIILKENRTPVRSLAWISVLFFIPFFGLIFYLFFGRSIKNKALISKRLKKRFAHKAPIRQADISKLSLSEESRQQIRLGHALSGATYFPSNKVDIFTSGEKMFSALCRDIEEAKVSINMQFYIFNDDTLGIALSNLLIKRAQEGIKVRIIYDHVGCFGVKKQYFKRMAAAGIEVNPFFKVTFPEFATRVNWRNHRKVTIIDNRIGYIGGMNVADRYVTGDRNGMWRDTHIRITGPSVYGLLHTFHTDWAFMELPQFDDGEDPAEFLSRHDGDSGIQILSSGPIGQWHNIALMFEKAIAGAKKCIYLATPYFLPTDSLMTALQAAALSKVDVRVLIPRKPDSSMMKLASGSYIADCLRAGIKVYFYEAGMLHAKTIVIDDEFFTTGSTNFDFRSMEYNFECNAFIYDRAINKQMKEAFYADLEQSTRITSATWRRRPFFQKFKESCVRLMSPVL